MCEAQRDAARRDAALWAGRRHLRNAAHCGEAPQVAVAAGPRHLRRGAACVYNVPPEIKRSWWFPLLNSITTEQYRRIYQWFTAVDKDHSGTLELIELITCQFPGGILLSPQTVLRMIRVFNTDFNCGISPYEFMVMYKFVEVCDELYAQNDKDRSGMMEPLEIKPMLAQLGFIINQSSETVVHRIFLRGARGEGAAA